MKKRPGPKTVSGWRARARRWEKAYREIAKVPDYWGEQWKVHRDKFERDVNALKAQVFDLTSAQSRFAQQDNTIRKIVEGWGRNTFSDVGALCAIATALHIELPPKDAHEDDELVVEEPDPTSSKNWWWRR